MNEITLEPNTDVARGKVVETKSDLPTHLIDRKCPNCGASISVAEVKADFPAEKLDFEALRKRWHGFFNQGTCFFTYSRCGGCGLLFAPSYLSNKSVGELYSSMPDNTAGQNINNLIKTQRSYFDSLRLFNVPKGDYLELGPDIGLFTKHIADEMNFENHYLIEPNKDVHARLIESVGGKSHRVSDNLFDLSSIPDQSISLAVMIHVLDHITDPKDMMMQIRSKMKKGGTILAVTHDEKSLMAQVFGKKWPAYCLQHPHLFNVKSTDSFLRGVGFSEIVTRKSYNHFSLPYLAQHFFWTLGFSKIKLPKADWMMVPLRLGNIITIAKV